MGAVRACRRSAVAAGRRDAQGCCNDHGNVILTVVNLSDSQFDQPAYGVNIGGTGDRWEEVFTSQAPQYDGWNISGNFLSDLKVQNDGRFYIRLPKWSVFDVQEKIGPPTGPA